MMQATAELQDTGYAKTLKLGLNRLSSTRCFRPWIVFVACLLMFPLSSSSQAEGPASKPPSASRPPEWLFPVNPPAPADPTAYSGAIRVPQSETTFLPNQLSDLFGAPDWHPSDHPAMPEVVVHGRPPGVYACGYCHLPDGSGRPENASLAGLPAIYIVQQVADMREGARRTAVPLRIPPKLMTELAAQATDTEIETAAQYFSSLRPQFRIRVVETTTVPRTYVAGWILAVDRSGPNEPIGERIVEVPEDVEQFEHRDSRAAFVAYVPVGAVSAGKKLVSGGRVDKAVACSGCHGADLKGAGNVPDIAGRSPTYIMRQLYDIQSGLRAGANIAPMVPVAARLSLPEMLQISSYLATLH